MLIRGIVIVIIGIAAFINILTVWMVMLTGIICGICSSFFNPAVSSAIPDLVSKKNMLKANSAQQFATSSTNLIGSLIGSVVYSFIGASVILVFNGITYIISGSCESFIKLQKQETKVNKTHLKTDIKTGYSFIINNRGLLILITSEALLNLLFSIFNNYY